jgi:hypothetical protein
VSSTYIRSLIADGNIAEAIRFLGHPHVVSGTVINGSLALAEGIQPLPSGRYIADLLSDEPSTDCVVTVEAFGKNTMIRPDIPGVDGKTLIFGLKERI